MVSTLSYPRNFREIASYSFFIAFLGLGAVVFIALFQFALPRTRYVHLGPVTQFDAQNPAYLPITTEGQTFFFWVVNVDGSLRVFDARSTHSVAHDKNCIVKWIQEAQPWNSNQNYFADPCSGSTWDKDGAYLFGPAPRDLDWYFTEVRDGDLWIDIMYPQLGHSWLDKQ